MVNHYLLDIQQFGVVSIQSAGKIAGDSRGVVSPDCDKYVLTGWQDKIQAKEKRFLSVHRDMIYGEPFSDGLTLGRSALKIDFDLSSD
jgi:hypothetical protein